VANCQLGAEICYRQDAVSQCGPEFERERVGCVKHWPAAGGGEAGGGKRREAAIGAAAHLGWVVTALQQRHGVGRKWRWG